jgi:hypothetical protein
MIQALIVSSLADSTVSLPTPESYLEHQRRDGYKLLVTTQI